MYWNLSVTSVTKLIFNKLYRNSNRNSVTDVTLRETFQTIMIFETNQQKFVNNNFK